jgi:hypothetical protein
MTDIDIIAELKKQMENAAFISAVEKNAGTIESLIGLGAIRKNLSPDVLTIILAIITGKLLISCEDDDSRQKYADHIKRIIDISITTAKEC